MLDVDDPVSEISSASKRRYCGSNNSSKNNIIIMYISSFARSAPENPGDDYIMIPSSTTMMHKHQFLSPGHVMYSQSGCTSSIVRKY